MTMRTLKLSADIIDSRDIIERFEELESEREELVEAIEEAKSNLDEEDHSTQSKLDLARSVFNAWSADYGEEFNTLRKICEEGENDVEDWIHGATLIRESYFVEYCQELVSDIGDMPREIPSYIEIDWKATAKNLKVDFYEIEIDGTTYLVR